MERKHSLQETVLKMGYKNAKGHPSLSLTKHAINLKEVKELHFKFEPLKLLQQNRGERVQNIGVANNF